MRSVFPQPGFVSGDVTAILATKEFVYADTFTITPLVGDPLLFTNYQQDVSVVPVYETITRKTFFAKALLISGLRMRSSIGITVDEQEISLDYGIDPIGYQATVSWPQALLQGRLDGAVVRRDRYLKATHEGPWVGGWTMFRGLVAGISKVGRSHATLKVKSELILLDTQMPRDLFEPNCKNTWGDANCGIVQSTYAVIGTVGAGSTRSALVWAGANATYVAGKVLIANGDSVTRVRTISRVNGTTLELAFPLDFDPGTGLSFTAYPGCARTAAACLAYHGDPTWKTRFKGFPYIPVAEAAVGVGTGGAGGKGGK